MSEISRVWDIEDRVCTAVLEEHHGMIFSCHMSSWEIYEPLLLSCGADGELKVWDVRKQEYRDALVGHYDSCVACSIQQDGQYGVSVGQDGIVRVWKIREFIDLNITLIVGEGGSGITRDYVQMYTHTHNRHTHNRHTYM
jgi:WD40 repeat protein